MSEAPELLLHHHLKKLRLPTFLSDYEKLAKQCAAENKDHVQYLLRLSELGTDRTGAAHDRTADQGRPGSGR